MRQHIRRQRNLVLWNPLRARLHIDRLQVSSIAARFRTLLVLDGLLPGRRRRCPGSGSRGASPPCTPPSSPFSPCCCCCGGDGDGVPINATISSDDLFVWLNPALPSTLRFAMPSPTIFAAATRSIFASLSGSVATADGTLKSSSGAALAVAAAAAAAEEEEVVGARDVISGTCMCGWGILPRSVPARAHCHRPRGGDACGAATLLLSRSLL